MKFVSMRDGHLEEFDTTSRPVHDHRCSQMMADEARKNSNIGRTRRKFLIQYRPDDGKWFLYNNGERGMEVIVCPYCGTRPWAGNQVTIE
jgi:hypothetical protein